MSMLECLPRLDLAESKEYFFKKIAQIFPTLSKEYKAIEEAHELVEAVFIGKKRDDEVSPYIYHLRYSGLLALYLQVTDHEVIIFVLLHDISEDYPELWPINRIKEKFGENVARLVECATKPPIKEYSSKEERDHRHYCRFCVHPRDFFKGILSERLHNVLTLSSCSLDKRRRKIAETWRYYMPFAQVHFILYYELKEALEKADEELKRAEETL